MNVYPGDVPQSEPHFGWVSIILYLTVTFVFQQRGTFDIVNVVSSFGGNICDSI